MTGNESSAGNTEMLVDDSYFHPTSGKLEEAAYRRIPIGDLIKMGEAELKTGPFGTQLKASEYTEKGTPVINVRNIGMGTLRTDK